MIANAVVDIWRSEGVFPVPKYEDDLKAFRFPSNTGTFRDGDYAYDYDRATMMSRVESLNVPWHAEKGDKSFVFTTTFIGFLWDIPGKLVSLPEEKRLKFRERVRQFLDAFSGHRCYLLDVDKIHGSLCHVAFVHQDGNSRLPSLSNFAASFKGNEYTTRYPPPSVFTDLKWWLAKLSIPHFTRSLHPRGPMQDLHLFIDASTSWGIGILIGGQWAAYQLCPDWKIPGRDICWLETIAIEILAYFLRAMGLQNVHLQINSDNKGAMGANEKGRCPNWHINLSVRRTYTVFSECLISPSYHYIESKSNPADPILRGILGQPNDRITHKIALPAEINTSFLYA